MSRPDVLTAHEVAQRFDLSPSAIYEAVKRGDIPNVGIGRDVRIPRIWIDQRLGADAGGITAGPDETAVVLPTRALPRIARLVRSLADLTESPLDQVAAATLELAATENAARPLALAPPS